MNRRRQLLLTLSATLVPFGGVCPAQSAPECDDLELTREQWMSGWMDTPTRSLHGALKLQRFVEPIYVLLGPIEWKNTATPALGALSVSAPAGFVTDLASIPRVFYSLLRPDGKYAYAAILHDYLYWSQHLDKHTADEIFRSAMIDLDVSSPVRGVLVTAVERFGAGAWQGNAQAKARGERRVLKIFPDNALARWSEWKTTPGVFR